MESQAVHRSFTTYGGGQPSDIPLWGPGESHHHHRSINPRTALLASKRPSDSNFSSTLPSQQVPCHPPGTGAGAAGDPTKALLLLFLGPRPLGPPPFLPPHLRPVFSWGPVTHFRGKINESYVRQCEKLTFAVHIFVPRTLLPQQIASFHSPESPVI